MHGKHPLQSKAEIAIRNPQIPGRAPRHYEQWRRAVQGIAELDDIGQGPQNRVLVVVHQPKAWVAHLLAVTIGQFLC